MKPSSLPRNETRPIHQIPIEKLSAYLCQFLVSGRQSKNGSEYKPMTMMHAGKHWEATIMV